MNPVRNFKDSPTSFVRGLRISNGVKKIRALILFSGGLDSILAAKILMEQGIKVIGLTFKSYFFGAEQAKKAAKDLPRTTFQENRWARKKPQKVVRGLGIPLKIIDFSKEHLEIVKKPKYGYGSSMNPCLDCHILMLKTTKEIMGKENFNFVATGEVLGERPMSQNRRALELVEKQSSLQGFLLRPLSAKLLKETIPEKKGWVNREALLDISGRSRKRQINLAKKWGIKEYPTPAGGCILTDLEFGKKLRELFEKFPECKGNDIELLKLGRHFWKNNSKIIVGRNHEENLQIKKLAQKGDMIVEVKDITGPTTLIRNYIKCKISKEVLEKAKDLTKYYSTKARDKKEVKFKILEK